jgi:hypothetical protein
MLGLRMQLSGRMLAIKCEALGLILSTAINSVNSLPLTSSISVYKLERLLAE